MTSFQSNAFVDYFVFTKPAIKFSKQGRYAGGIRKNYILYVSQLVCSNMLLFLIDKDLFGVMKDILYVCVCVSHLKALRFTRFLIWKMVLVY